MNNEETMNVQDLDESKNLIEFNGKEYEVKPYLSTKDMMLFVYDVADGVVDPDTLLYQPAYRQPLVAACMLSYYCGIDMPDYGEDKDIIDVVYGTDVVDQIKRVINPDQYFDMVDAIDEIIKSRVYSAGEAAKRTMANVSTVTEFFRGYIEKLDLGDIQRALSSIEHISDIVSPETGTSDNGNK